MPRLSEAPVKRAYERDKLRFCIFEAASTAAILAEFFARLVRDAERKVLLVPDNLKAVVTRADWYDPDIHSKIRSFCAHYGTVMLPTKPRTPRHKG